MAVLTEVLLWLHIVAAIGRVVLMAILVCVVAA